MKRILLRSAALAAAILSTTIVAEAQTALSYYPLTPCRAVDTRGANAVNGGPKFGQGTQRNFTIRGRCGVPSTAKAVSLNVTVTEATTSSWLAIWPSGQARPNVSTINFDQTDPALANGAIVGLSTATQDLSVFNVSGAVHVLIDVTGYFQ